MNQVKFNLGNAEIVGARGLIRDSEGKLIMGFSKVLGISSNNYVEGVAMWYEIKSV